MFAVKLKKKYNNKIVFEVLTRSPFIGKNFTIESEDFLNNFVEVKSDMIETNILNSKRNVYRCKNEKFTKKLYWWNKNIYEIDYLYNSVYKKNGSLSNQLVQLDMLNSFIDEYGKRFKNGYPIFIENLKMFKALFDSGK